MIFFKASSRYFNKYILPFLRNRNKISEPIEEGLLYQFEENCKKIHDQLEADRYKGILYHYTNYDSLINILKTRQIRYSDYRYLNDPFEIKYGKNLILQTIDRTDIHHKELFVKIINDAFDVFNNKCNIYVSCYASKVDRLALWRYYANNGCGFAIAFNDSYQKIVETDSLVGKRIISQVIYGQNANNLINQLIEQYNKVLQNARSQWEQISNQDYFIFELDKKLILQFLSVLPFLKDDSFSDEHEIRIFCLEGDLVIDPSSGKPFYFPEDQKEYIPIENKKIPFVNYIAGHKPVLYPDQFNHDSISEIWVGPSCEFRQAKKFLEEKLSSFGYPKSVEIKQAPFSYRG